MLKDLDLEVNGGQIVGLLGPNGAGKTTAMGIIAGEPAHELRHGVARRSIPRCLMTHERARRGLVYLPQAPSVVRDCTVWENMSIAVQGLTGSASQADARLDQLGIGHLRQAKAGELSGGERRRLEIARSLVGTPKILVLDEPFAGIDPVGVEQLQQVLLSLAGEGLGILLTDHSVEATLGICDHAIIIDAGTVMKEGRPEAVSEDDRVRARYLGHRFVLKTAGKPGHSPFGMSRWRTDSKKNGVADHTVTVSMSYDSVGHPPGSIGDEWRLRFVKLRSLHRSWCSPSSFSKRLNCSS